MLCVIPFCAKDEESCLTNLRLALMLDGDDKPYQRCLLTYDSSTPEHRVKDLASKLFKEVHLHCYQIWTGESRWPTPQNWAWQSTARYISKKFNEPWFWWEADVVPLVEGWFATLEKAHIKGGKPFSGHIVPSMGHMTGVGIYPPNVSGYSNGAMITRSQPFDVFLGSTIQGKVNQINNLICHVWSLDKLGNPSQLPGNPPSFQNDESIGKLIPKTSVIFHRNKDCSLAELIINKLKKTGSSIISPSAITFGHSGDLGDILYSLPSIKSFGKGSLILTEYGDTRVKMTPDHARTIIPLLKIQPYIENVDVAIGRRPNKSFDQFRKRIFDADYTYGTSVAKLMAETVKASPDCTNEPWITIDHPVSIKNISVVINRSLRYHNHRFPWLDIKKRYHNESIFVGTPDEHALFVQQFGWKKIPFFPTDNLLEVARLIAGCDLFIGNQSAPFAIAEGLKKRRILEVFIPRPDCLFFDKNVTHGWDETTPIAI